MQDTVKDNEQHKGFAAESLASIRKKLLDLTGRNSLLNYRHPKTGCIRIIDELPDQIVDALKSDKPFTFLSVPEPNDEELIEAGYLYVNPETGEKEKPKEWPSAKEWAKHVGYDANYDLPAADEKKQQKHIDSNLQTALYTKELDARLHGLRSHAETAIEESGANILFLCIGFLEWVESSNSDRKRLAPLFTLPVKLERSNKIRHGKFHYTISLKDDELISNITLREKLANDFHLSLPSIDDDTTPEAYFQLVTDTILAHQPRWKIRRQATLLLLNFTKQIMYEDLDPANWPEHANIKDHPLISRFFGAEGNEAGSTQTLSYESEYPIDDVDDIHQQFPLIFDADSSQHSALIDAVKGENLVIEGPPGSGKSQTITNLIAAAISNGKQVLFVAEKMAALNVVKDRLDKAGLGDFCLELHSHKTNKLKVLGDLNIRLNNQKSYRNPREITDDIARFEDLKDKLKNYVELINQEWNSTGLTIHEILNKATRFREQLKLTPEEFSIDGVDGNQLTPLKQRELYDQAENLKSIFDQVSEQASNKDISRHFWYGVTNTELMGYELESLSKALSHWNNALASLYQYWQNLSQQVDLEMEGKATLFDIETFSASIQKLPELVGNEPLGEVQYLSQRLEQYSQWLDDYTCIHQTHTMLGDKIHQQALMDTTNLDQLDGATTIFHDFGVNSSTSLSSLSDYVSAIDRTIATLQQIETQFEQVSVNIPQQLSPCFSISGEGLREFKIMVGLIEKLPADLWRHRDDVYDNVDLDSLLDQMTQRLSVLTPLHKTLHEHFSLHRLPDTQMLAAQTDALFEGGLFKWFSSDWRSARKAILALSAAPKPDKKTLLALAPDLVKYSQGIDEMNRLNQQDDALQELYQGVETPIDRVKELRGWYKQVRNEYGLGFGSRVEMGDALLTLDRNLAMAIKDFARQELSRLVNDAQMQVVKFAKAFPGYTKLRNKDNLLNSSLHELYEKLAQQLRVLQPIVRSHEFSVEQLKEMAMKLHRHQTMISDWIENEITQKMTSSGLPLDVKPDAYSQPTYDMGRNLLAISAVMASNHQLLHSLSSKPDKGRYQQILQAMPGLIERQVLHKETQVLFKDPGMVNMDEWMESSNGQLSALINKNEEALANPNWLNTWLDYIRLKNKLSSEGLANIIVRLEDHSIETESLSDVINLTVFHQLATEIFSESPEIASFNGMEQMAYRNRFREYDRKLLELQRELIAYKASRVSLVEGVNSGRVGDYSEMGLIRHTVGQKRPRIAVRSLLSRAGNSIQALKPCLMMSPMSVAQYLQPGCFNFDLVVMDEASQIRPEDGLGAIARGNSLVVVGDPKQLPPTSFFQKVLDNEDDENKVGLEVSESILDSVMPMFRNRRLRWHYRSRHESLIAFSNYNFYDNNLILFPSPQKENDEFGVKYRHVANGSFVGGRNKEEANEIVLALQNHLIHHAHESVGVVSMNSEQKDEIESRFEKSIQENDQLQRAYEKNLATPEPLFIKNLENVQGDERDVIIISMTYGPENPGAGSMHQRFGPINMDVGWRRLNVLFTRSKKRMNLFSSMNSGHVVTSERSSKGVLALKAFLAYCETGTMQHQKHTGKASDSDFEIAVITALAMHGYKCEPQLGVAGYFLDIAVKDPGMPGRFLMGIECDGASYHSAKSTRDRDRLRQEILENLGWRIRRIWSTDWFKNPQAQLEPIIRELDELKTSGSFTAKSKDGKAQLALNLGV